MDVYADSLVRSLGELLGPEAELHEVTPTAGRWFGRAGPMGRWSSRMSRYVGYPIQARSHNGDVNHIIDHGYGHLLYALDAKRTVVTVHDLIPHLTWRGVIAGEGANHPPLLGDVSLRAIRRAGAVVADSERTKRDLVEYFKFRPEAIAVIHPGVATTFRPLGYEGRRTAREALGLPLEKTNILITGWQHYKNHSSAVAAFDHLRRASVADVHLVRLGRMTKEWRDLVKAFGLDAQVHEIEWLEADQMANLYNAVDLLLFPSRYEGFGWPPLEAMACGTAVVSSNAGALPEVIGKAGIMADPDDVDGLVSGMKTLIEDSNLKDMYIRRGVAQAGKFAWERTASSMRDIYNELDRRA
jgi:glycosyltransferase involved in cell wall biosynthesis